MAGGVWALASTATSVIVNARIEKPRTMGRTSCPYCRAKLLGGAADPCGGRALGRHALDQAVDAFLLHHRVELGAVGEHQADALDHDVVDLPARIGLVHRVGELRRLGAGP